MSDENDHGTGFGVTPGRVENLGAEVAFAPTVTEAVAEQDAGPGAAPDEVSEPEGRPALGPGHSESVEAAEVLFAPTVTEELWTPPTIPTPSDSEPSDETDLCLGEGIARTPSRQEIRAAIEAVLYAAGDPVSFRELKKVFPDVAPEEIRSALAELVESYGVEGKGLHIIEVAGGYQITTRPEYHDRVSSMFEFKPPSRLSIPALETLATIAYRQPVTVPEIMELRGVRSAGVVRTLLEKKLIRIMGRKPVVGRPLLYGTTKEFLNRFGLKNLKELPQLEDMAELFGDDVAQQLEEALGEGARPPAEAGVANEAPAGTDESSGADGNGDAERL